MAACSLRACSQHRACTPLNAQTCSWLLSPSQTVHHSNNNQQLVPRVPLHNAAALHHAVQAGLQHSAAGAVVAVAATAVPPPRAAAVAAALPTTQQPSLDDATSTTRARLYALYEFVATHERLPEVQETHQGVAVGQWAEKCRQLHKQQQEQQQQHSGLEPDLAAALQTIPGWSWEPTVAVLSDSFARSLQELIQYTQEHGPPPMRLNKRTSSASPLPDAAAAAAGGDDGSSSSSSNVTTSSSSSSGRSRGGHSLGQPSASQRTAAVALSKQLVEQRKRGVLTQQQIDTIANSVPGWRWDNRIRSPALDTIIAHLQDYHRQHGALPKADAKLANGFLIGEWCMARRGEYSRGQLELDVAAALESQVPGWLWNRLDNVFEKNLEALGLFVAAHGRTPTQRETWEGVRVGAWCNKRRLQYKAGTLAADRVAALEAIPGWWWNCDQMPI